MQALVSPPSVVILALRVECSFQRKAVHAQTLGAVALIIYGTLRWRYGYNDTSYTVRPQSTMIAIADLDGLIFLGRSMWGNWISKGGTTTVPTEDI